MVVSEVDMLKELVSVFYLQHIFSIVRGIRRGADGPDFKVFHEKVSHNWSHGCYLNLLIILTPGKEGGFLEAEPQQGNDILDGYGCSIGEVCTLLQFVLHDVNSGIQWNKCKQCFDIISDDELSFLKLDVFNVVRGKAYHGCKNPCICIGHPIWDNTSARHYWS